MATYRLPFGNVQGWSVGKGNFDDPNNPHGSGQPFAWDFIYAPSNPSVVGYVVAARAGTVTDVRDGMTSVINYEDTNLGPGNYIIIEHADNTIAAYDHLKNGSILVSIGDYVEQGTIIATVGNTGTTHGTVHLHFEVVTWFSNNGTAGTPTDNDGGASMRVQLEDENHTSWRPLVNDTLNPITAAYRQDAWRFCYKCASLYFAYPGSPSVCPGGAGGHATRGGNYTVSDDANANGQPLWKHCKKCGVMFYSGNGGTRCPVTSPTNAHDGTGSGNYRLIHDVSGAPGQDHWRYCDLCEGLWFQDAATSVCPANSSGPHSMAVSGNYIIEVNPEDVQHGWRRCNKCGGIYYAPNGVGVCKGGAGGHAHDGDVYYSLLVEVSPINTTGTAQTGWQGGWKYCGSCGLLWMGANTGSDCPATNHGAHISTNSGNYFLRLGGGSGGQSNWKWCGNCQGIWLQEAGYASKCSANGLAHVSSGSTYEVIVSDDP